MLTLGITDGSDDLGAAMPRAPSAPIVNRIGKRSGRRPIENHHCPSTLLSFLTVSVPGPDGIRVARAGQPLNFRRSAEPHYAGASNLKVKYRESFRPFAPSVLREEVASWFDLNFESPYMLMVAPASQPHVRHMRP
jgi:hypothetical protein